MRRTLMMASVVALSTAIGCSAPNVRHSGDGSGGTGVGGNGNGTGNGPGSGGTVGSGGGGSGGAGGGANCGVQMFNLTKSGTPDLLLVQDRSGSMSMDPDGADPSVSGNPAKWDSITAAINQVVSSVTTVDWGLLFFEPAGILGGLCMVPSTPDVPCGPNTATSIAMAITNTQPGGGTPTAEAINAGAQYLSGNTDGHAHYMLLATDGLPDCSGNNDVQNAEDAVANAAKMGIKTVVVGIGNDATADTTLKTMAKNGGMPNQAGPKDYYQVSSTMDLVKVLDQIAGTIVSCEYALQTVPANPNLVSIQDNNGKTIPHDTTHMNGWDYGPGNMSIQFYGAACDALQKGITTGLNAVSGCPPIS